MSPHVLFWYQTSPDTLFCVYMKSIDRTIDPTSHTGGFHTGDVLQGSSMPCSKFADGRGVAAGNHEVPKAQRAPFMRQLLELGVWQVVAHDVSDAAAVEVGFESPAMQRHDLLELLTAKGATARDLDGLRLTHSAWFGGRKAWASLPRLANELQGDGQPIKQYYHPAAPCPLAS